jgi:hypothetical protein
LEEPVPGKGPVYKTPEGHQTLSPGCHRKDPIPGGGVGPSARRGARVHASKLRCLSIRARPEAWDLAGIGGGVMRAPAVAPCRSRAAFSRPRRGRRAGPEARAMTQAAGKCDVEALGCFALPVVTRVATTLSRPDSVIP